MKNIIKGLLLIAAGLLVIALKSTCITLVPAIFVGLLYAVITDTNTIDAVVTAWGALSAGLFAVLTVVLAATATA